MTGPRRTSNLPFPASNDPVGRRRSFPWCGKKFSTLWKSWVFLFAAAGAPVLADEPGKTPAAEPAPWIAEADWGPLASWIVDADGNDRFRAAGPFWENAESPDGKKLTALPRPLWARATDPAADKVAWDFCWPLAAGKTFGKEKSWRVLLTWFFDADRTDPRSRYRCWALPLWFHGRDDAGRGYAALFPLGGSVGNFLGRDRAQFALWPLWIHSRINDVETTDVLWPIYGRTTSPDHHLESRRVFPFYMWTKNVRQFEKTAILWPFWTHARYVHPKAHGTAWVLFPLCGRVNLNSQQGWLFLPPFFQHVRSEQLTRTVVLWPFFVRETGVREKLYVWPLCGRRRDGALERRFWLWPLAFRDVNEWGFRKQTRWLLMPLWTCTTQTENPQPTGRKAAPNAAAAAAPAEPAPKKPRVVAQRAKLWPLYSRQYDLDEQTYRLRLLDLWPAGQPPPVERSWAPLWTVLDYRAHGASRDLDVLWGLVRDARRADGARATTLFPLWRHERAAGDAARRWSVLKGLIAYDRTATNRQVRFLWLGRVRLAPPAGPDAKEP